MKNTFPILARIAPILILFPLFHGGISAQPAIDIRVVRPQTDFFYSIHLAASCNGEPVLELMKHQISISQDGIPIIPFNYFIYRQPPAEANACFNAALVFDRSNRLSPNGGEAIATAAGRFVDSMSRACHQTTIISYSNAIDIHEFLTSDTSHLRAAARALATAGANRTYDILDGIRTAMTEIETHGTEQFRVIVAFTAGGDDLSAQRIDELLAAMRYSLYRIFIVVTPASVNRSGFERLARATGGRVIPVESVDRLADLYGSLAESVKRELDEFQIFYQAPSVFPGPKILTVGIAFCNDSTHASYSFQSSPTGLTEQPAVPDVPRLALYPQPVSRISPQVRMRMNIGRSLIGSTAEIVLTDVLGRRILHFISSPLADGENDMSIHLPAMPAGLYVCHALIGPHHLTRSIIVTD